jgi:hypothetical protein
MKQLTIKEIKEIANQIETFDEVSEVVIEKEQLTITLIPKKDDMAFFQNLKIFEKKVYQLTGDYPVPCDVNHRDWFVYLDVPQKKL